jgi:hypothetical protein
MRRKFFISAIITLALTSSAFSQEVAIKTNLLYDATSTINLGMEVGLSKHWTAQLAANLNPWVFKTEYVQTENKDVRMPIYREFKHWAFQPEVRRYFCQRFDGFFIGAYAQGGRFNAGKYNMPFNMFKCLDNHHYEGWFVGGGVNVGYELVLAKHWNAEASLGAGYDFLKSDKYSCVKCEPIVYNIHTHYFGVNSASLSVLYFF